MAYPGVLTPPLSLDSAENPVSNSGAILEVVQCVVAGVTLTIYGKDNATGIAAKAAGTADIVLLSKINTLVSAMVSAGTSIAAGTDDHITSPVSTTTTTNDTCVVTIPAAGTIDVWVIGYAERS